LGRRGGVVMVGRRDSVDRVDYTIEQIFVRSRDEQGDVPDHVREHARELVEKEDERMWAHYRDPRTDLTQTEARDRAQSVNFVDYPPRANISQATVSRRISRLDDRVLTEPLALLNVREREHPEGAPGLLSRGRFDALDRGRFDDLLDQYREALARFLVDLDALDRFKRTNEPTPAWARARFDDLDPAVGRRVGLFDDVTPSQDIHASLDELDDQRDGRRTSTD
jgi:hypothetical protein